MSKELKRRGFRFVGPTVCYAFMQACGLVNDHTVDCFRYREVATLDELAVAAGKVAAARWTARRRASSRASPTCSS